MRMAAGQFKARCLKLMDMVRRRREEVVITKHGKPVARLVPLENEPEQPLFGRMRGSVTITGDIVSPTGAKWDAED